MRGLLYIVLSLIFLTSSFMGQAVSGQATGDLREDFLYGEYYLSQGQFEKALPFYLSCYEMQPENSNYNYRIGQCYSNLLGKKHSALSYLKEAVNEIDRNYVDGKYKGTGAPPEAWLLLGDAYHRENNLKKASYAYHQYLNYLDESDKKTIIMVRDRIAGLGISYEFQREDIDIRMVNMGEIVNTRFSDYNPVLSRDQTMLVYTQFWESFDRIMFSQKVEDEWTQPVEITKELGSQGNAYTSSLSFDGRKLFLIKYADYNYDIYVAEYLDGQWQPMKPLPGEVNTRDRESSVALGPQGETLYFSSDRRGGEGGFDLYKASLIDGEWGKIENLGNVINTPGNEEAPFLTPDGKTMYFSSDGHSTIGNMDILYALADSNGNWKKPENIGTPVNTTEDDLFFVYYGETKTGYLSRDIPSGYGKNDIYKIQEVVVAQNRGEEKAGPSSVIESPHMRETEFKEVEKNNETQNLVASKSAGNDERANFHNSTTNNSESVSGNAIIAPGTGFSEGIDGIAEESDQTSPVKVMNSPTQTVLSTNQSETANDLKAYEGSNASAEQEIFVNSHIREESSTVNKLYAEEGQILNEGSYASGSTFSAGSNSGNFNEIPDSLPIYTIQISALHNPVEPSYFSLQPLTVSPGSDGFHRYTYGEYRGYSTALNLLYKLRKSGYPDAFIRNIDTILNYQGN